MTDNPFNRGMRVMFRHIDVPRSHPDLRRGTVTEAHQTSVTVQWDAKNEHVPSAAGSYHHSALVQIEHEPPVTQRVIVEVIGGTTCMTPGCGHDLRTHGPVINYVIGSCGTFGCKCLHGTPA